MRCLLRPRRASTSKESRTRKETYTALSVRRRRQESLVTLRCTSRFVVWDRHQLDKHASSVGSRDVARCCFVVVVFGGGGGGGGGGDLLNIPATC